MMTRVLSLRKMLFVWAVLFVSFARPVSADQQSATQEQGTAITAYDLALYEHDEAVIRLDENGITNPWTVQSYAVAMDKLESAALFLSMGNQDMVAGNWDSAEANFTLSIYYSNYAWTVFRSIYP